jgi:hypothetical protein
MKVSRRHLFDTVDKPALRPLPPYRYEFAQWKKVTVNIDYHIEWTATITASPTSSGAKNSM